MKKNYMKLIVTLACLTMLLTIAVSSTVAFLTDGSGPVVNQFGPAEVTTTITEEFDGETKNGVIINNTSEIPVYVRVTIIGSWMKDGKVVDDWSLPGDFVINEADWLKGSDGFFYYKRPLAPAGNSGASTTDLFGTDSEITATTADGAVLTVTVISQAIQADGKNAAGQYAVEEAWGVNVAADGTITK